MVMTSLTDTFHPIAGPSKLPASSERSAAPGLGRRRPSHRSRLPTSDGIDEADEEDDNDPFLLSLDDSESLDAELDDFLPSKWLDEQLDVAFLKGASESRGIATASLPQLDSTLSRLLTNISIARKDLNNNVDVEIDAAQRSVPRIVGQIPWIGQRIQDLQGKLQTLPHQIAEDEAMAQQPSQSAVVDSRQDTASLSRLAELYRLNSQLTSYRSLLRLASSWSALSSDVSLLLSEATAASTTPLDAIANFNSASLRIKEARDSLQVFGNTKEGEEKRELLARLTADFETSLTPLLVATVKALPTKEEQPADTTQEIEVLKSILRILASVGKAESFGEIWRPTRSATLLQAWSQAALTEEEESQQEPTSSIKVAFSQWLPNWLAAVVALLPTERAYASILFVEDPLSALDLLLTSIFKQLDPPMLARVESVRAAHQDKSLKESIKILRAVREKGREIDKALSRLAAATALERTPLLDRKSSSSSQRPRRGSDANKTTLQQADEEAANPQLTRRASLNRRHSRMRSSLVGNRRMSSNDELPTLNLGVSSGVTSSAVPLDYEYVESFYAILAPLWQIYSQDELALLRLSWSQESRTSDLTAPESQSEPTSLGDEPLPTVLDKVHRSISLVSELSEDSLARCLEVTRGTDAQGLLHAVAQVSSDLFSPAARQVEEQCNKVWSGLASGSAPTGREWTAYGRIVSTLASLTRLKSRLSRLHTTLLGGLKEAAVVLAQLDTDSSSATAQDVAEKLARLKGVNGSGIDGPAPLVGEMLLLLKSPLVNDLEKKNLREQILTLADVPSSSLSAGNSDSRAQGSRQANGLPLLPSLSTSLDSLSRPLLHTFLLLPLMPILTSLFEYPQLPHWTSNTAPGSVANEYQLSMPSFSLGPTEVMQSVGEAVLGLVRELESWLAEDGWKGGVQMLLARQREAAVLASTAQTQADDEEERKRARRRTSMLPNSSSSPQREKRQSSYILGNADATTNGGSPSTSTLMPDSVQVTGSTSTDGLTVGEGGKASTSPQEISPSVTRQGSISTMEVTPSSDGPSQDLLPLYLSALLDFLCSHLTRRILPALPSKNRISKVGWKQLETDLGWLRRVMGVLEGIEVSEEEDGADDEERGQDDSKQKGRLSGWRQVVGVERPLSGSEEEDEFGYVSPFGTRQPARFLRKAPEVEPQQATLAGKQATLDKKRGAVDLSAMSASVGMGW